MFNPNKLLKDYCRGSKKTDEINDLKNEAITTCIHYHPKTLWLSKYLDFFLLSSNVGKGCLATTMNFQPQHNFPAF